MDNGKRPMRRKYASLSWFGLLIMYLIPFNAMSQTNWRKWPNEHNDCSGNCFSAEVVSAVPGENGCTDIEMRVSHNGSCRYELSHFVVEIPCGYVYNVKAPGGCGNDFGKDPTTGLTGLKIDGVRNFGKGTLNYFTVKFSWCNNSSCQSLDCWEPRVAFKAATCVDYDTATNSCQSETLKATLQTQNATCAGSPDGRLSVTAEGGEGPYTYTWSTGCNQSSIDHLPAGSYTVTVTDASGNETTLTGVVTSVSNLELTAVTVNPSCAGIPNGNIDLTVVGGAEPYTYRWSNGAMTQDIVGLAGGSYQVTVTDSLGCSTEEIFQLTAPVISVSGQTIRPGCGQSNGQIDITVNGGSGPYTFLWSNGSTLEDASGLAAGFYSVVVTDSKFCSSRTGFLLSEDNTLRISFQVTPTGCVDNHTGAIDITVTGGTPPYAYNWMNGSTAEDINGLPAGIQRVTVTDAGGCTASSVINVFSQGFTVQSQVVPPSCTGTADGSITLTPMGVPPFSYLWSTGATTNAISNLTSGLYSVTVTDQTGCVQSLNYYITAPVINLFAMVSNPNCGAEGDFEIDLTVNGGVAPYTYQWSTGETSEDLSGLTSGTYQVTVTDANGCGKTVDVIVEPVVIGWACSITPTAENPVCGSAGNQLSTTVTGALYDWSVESDDEQWTISSGEHSSSITYTAGGNGSSATFSLSITKNGCTQTCSYRLATCVPVMTCGPDTTSAVISNVAVDSPVTATQSDEINPPADGSSSAEFGLAAYPNPVRDKLSFDWKAEMDEYVQIDLIDLYGKRIAELYSGEVRGGENYRIEWDVSQLNDRLYFYRYASGTRTVFGKILRGN